MWLIPWIPSCRHRFICEALYVRTTDLANSGILKEVAYISQYEGRANSASNGRGGGISLLISYLESAVERVS
ncbi:hypothetical protein LshimejAT787_0704860 [Lyophyllum shimeji]|uniref:Uncharacterized protein n=1 Tax=Lyophyllum shimeji TaxID=47721 RepID=A0A9P3PRE7_LYOSH|nr:hypothetical protein LshimejAT787_0704860 [Lyophyllum shimeji]